MLMEFFFLSRTRGSGSWCGSQGGLVDRYVFMLRAYRSGQNLVSRIELDRLVSLQDGGNLFAVEVPSLSYSTYRRLVIHDNQTILD